MGVLRRQRVEGRSGRVANTSTCARRCRRAGCSTLTGQQLEAASCQRTCRAVSLLLVADTVTVTGSAGRCAL